MGEVAEILIVSNNLGFRQLVGAELKERGYNVEGAENIEEEVPRLKQKSSLPDLILIEALGQHFELTMLPDLKALSRKTKLVVCAGPFDLAEVDFAQFGIGNIIKKPVLIHDLVKEISRLIRN